MKSVNEESIANLNDSSYFSPAKITLQSAPRH
jgi:hypothetical protein